MKTMMAFVGAVMVAVLCGCSATTEGEYEDLCNKTVAPQVESGKMTKEDAIKFVQDKIEAFRKMSPEEQAKLIEEAKAALAKLEEIKKTATDTVNKAKEAASGLKEAANGLLGK